MPILKNIPIPTVSRVSGNEFDLMEVGDALITSVTDLGGDVARARRRVQSRVSTASKRLGHSFSIRVISAPIAGVDVALPAVGVWRTA